MRITRLLFLLGLASLLQPLSSHAAAGLQAQALLISASNGKGGTDPRLAPYESTLRRNLPFDTFRLAGEGSTPLAPGGRGVISLGQGHRLEIENEKGGPGLHLKVRWLNGSTPVMSTSLTLQPGVPAVLGRRGGGDGEVPVILLLAR